MTRPNRSCLSHRSALLAAITGLIALATGCASTDLRIVDQGAIAPTGRVVWQPIGAVPDGRFAQFSGLSLEGDVSYAQAEARDDNGIDAGESIRIGGNTVPGSNAFNARGGVLDVKGTIRGGLQLGGVFRFEPMVGIEVVNARLTVTGSTGQFSQERTATGFLYGFRTGIQAHEMVEFYGRVMNGILGGSSTRVDSAYSLHAEVGLRVAPIDPISVFAGYRWAQFEFQIDKEQTDPLYSLDGPVVGLELRF